LLAPPQPRRVLPSCMVQHLTSAPKKLDERPELSPAFSASLGSDMCHDLPTPRNARSFPTERASFQLLSSNLPPETHLYRHNVQRRGGARYPPSSREGAQPEPHASRVPVMSSNTPASLLHPLPPPFSFSSFRSPTSVPPVRCTATPRFRSLSHTHPHWRGSHLVPAFTTSQATGKSAILILIAQPFGRQSCSVRRIVSGERRRPDGDEIEGDR
jgi:hypothetical protein